MKLVWLIKTCLTSTWCISYSIWSETRRCFITAAFKLCFRIYH